MAGRNRNNNFSKPNNLSKISLDSSPYLQSLKLQEMPDYIKTLKAKNDKVKEQRVTDVRNFGYNKNVLVGNWFEERKHPNVRHVNTYCTTYNAEYLPPLTYHAEEKQKTDMKYPVRKYNVKNGNEKPKLEDKTCSKCDNSATNGRCMYSTEYTTSYVPHKLTKTGKEIIKEVKKLPQRIGRNCSVRPAVPVRCTNIAKA